MRKSPKFVAKLSSSGRPPISFTRAPSLQPPVPGFFFRSVFAVRQAKSRGPEGKTGGRIS